MRILEYNEDEHIKLDSACNAMIKAFAKSGDLQLCQTMHCLTHDSVANTSWSSLLFKKNLKKSQGQILDCGWYFHQLDEIVRSCPIAYSIAANEHGLVQRSQQTSFCGGHGEDQPWAMKHRLRNHEGLRWDVMRAAERALRPRRHREVCKPARTGRFGRCHCLLRSYAKWLTSASSS